MFVFCIALASRHYGIGKSNSQVFFFFFFMKIHKLHTRQSAWYRKGFFFLFLPG